MSEIESQQSQEKFEAFRDAELPLRVQVESLERGRYVSVDRPESWDERHAGVDIVKTTEGKRVKLLSDGGQSTPQPGWVLMLTSGNSNDGYRWTLYGLPRRL